MDKYNLYTLYLLYTHKKVNVIYMEEMLIINGISSFISAFVWYFYTQGEAVCNLNIS